MSPTVVDTIYERSLNILRYLDSQSEVTYRSDFEESFKKNLVLSISSYFEDLICQIILEYVEARTEHSETICSFFKNRFKRQFHTFFDWDSKNANTFFSLFGEEFKKRCESRVKSDPDLDAGIKAFIELGETRNSLVHLNFASYQLPKTSEEYYLLYQTSLRFTEFVKEQLHSS